MQVKLKKLLPGARLPEKATEGSAAYDLYVPEDTIVKPGRQTIPLGFAMEMEEGYEALVDPRSGFSSKGMEGHGIKDGFSMFDTPFGSIEFRDKAAFISRIPQRFDCDAKAR